MAMSLANVAHGADTPVTSDITADTTWTADNIYLLAEPIFVKNGASLTIEPGTVIYGYEDVVNGTFGSLVITRGSKIYAEGTADRPIVFSAALEGEVDLGRDLDGDGFVETIALDPYTEGGFWGGLVVLGNAPINYFDSSSAQTESSIEGFPATGSDIDYGGLDPLDNSGVIRYVSIQFGGYEFAADNEINGLTLGGVGAGTTIEFVEVVANTDDGVEFFGGTVNTSHLVMAFNQDESFDIDQGHQGCHQFWFALQSTSSDNGTEADGGDGTNSPDKTQTPLTLTTIHNATYIGGGSTAGSSNDGFRLKDNFAGQFHNSVFHDFGGQLFRIDDTSTEAQVGVNLLFQNNTFGTFAAGDTHNGSTAELALLAQSGNSATGTDPLLTSLVRTAGEVSIIDPRPATGSPLLTSSLSEVASKSCFAEVDYRGAFGTDNWAAGWTYISKKGFFGTPAPAARPEVAVTADITTNTTWTNTNNYVLDRPIFVKNGAELTIEAGTQIYGYENFGTGTFGSLVVTMDGTINASGTAEEPIVFTAALQAEVDLGRDIDGDGFTETIPLDPAIDGGFWGGVVILGEAPINYFDSSSAQTSTAIEGFPATGSDVTYGGNNATDNSGTFRYVSIQFGGFEFAADNEINGLTLGGVGSGTTIEYIEVIANTDDGVEFFGGTVSTNNMVVAYCQDEAFDFDQGHQGVHQFLFTIQSENGDNGTEADGGDGTNSPDKTQSPLTNTQIFNATYIGGGSTAGSSNDGFRLKDNFAGQFHNSIFHDFGGHAVRIDDSSTEGQVGGNLLFNNNIFGAFASGDTQNGSTAELALLAQTGNTVVGTDPLLRGVYALRVGSLDPRPRCDSPAWLENGATLTDVPADLVEVDYRGAFGEDNWAAGWTYLSNYGIMAQYPAAGSLAEASEDYQDWVLGESPDSVLGVAPLDDLNKDGLPNVDSYAFGLDPFDSSDRTGLVTVTDDGVFTFKRRNTTGAPTYSVFVEETLPFETAAVLTTDYTELSVTSGDYDTVTVTIDSAIMSVNDKVFSRVEAK